MDINVLLAKLTEEHRKTLSWFLENSGKESVPYTLKVDGVTVVSAGQGIYKPKGENYVLSVKETINGNYPDQEPVIMPEGGWFYAYHQRGDDSLETREKLWDNKALTFNMKESIPVGVLLEQPSKDRKKRYKTGLAVPVAWVGGYFILAGASPTGEIPKLTKTPGEMLAHIIMANEKRSLKTFDPTSVSDARKRTLREIVQRQGQPQFRKTVLESYSGKCPITGCDTIAVLEAAHFSPYIGPETNCVQNGAPLRADLHTLWDRGYIYVDTSNMTVVVHPDLLSSQYGAFHGRPFTLPKDPNNHPSKLALDAQRDFCGF